MEFRQRETIKLSDSETEKNQIELLYDGHYYDVTNWVPKHPGGEIIKLYTDSREDATIPIQQFHAHVLNKVLLILKSFPKRIATPHDSTFKDAAKMERHKVLTEDFQKLAEELKVDGLMSQQPFRFARRLFEAFCIFIFGLFMSYYFSGFHISLRILSVFIITLAGGQGLWLGHESGHNAFTGIRKIDRIFQIMGYGFVFGLSASSWNATHSMHHAMPQHVSHDADLKTLPLVAFNKKIVKTQKDANSFWLQNQKWLFVLCDTLFITLIWKFNHHIRFCIKNKKWFDLFCMGCHYGLVPLLGPIDWFFVTWIGSIYVLGNLVLSHTHLPAVEDGTELHWVEYAFHHTTNIRSSWCIDWWTGHLNYQIEHHLFPNMPQFKNKLASKKVKEFARKHNLPYHLCSYSTALKNTYKNLESVSYEIRRLM